MAAVEFLAQGMTFYPVSERCKAYFEKRQYQADSEGWYDIDMTAMELSAALRETESA